ncbi:MAG TPA: hypothetical protein VKV17_08100 [Bryobacteraceae bacterium]|nr:hypothetical protein [Bryobacteraceae bacterium]
MRFRAVVVVSIAPLVLLAQDVASQSAPAPTTGPQSAQWRALSVTEKLKYDARHFVAPEHVVYSLMGAALDQWRDRPGEWGEGWGVFGERWASHLGQYTIQRSIIFPVQAIDGEDTRYFRSTRTSIKGRVADAFLHTVWRHDDSGGMMPAYSEFFGDYGAAAVSRYAWWPRRYHNGTAVFIAGSNTMLIDAGINLFHEFTPDIKRALRLGR